MKNSTHWKEKHHKALASAKNFTDLLSVAYDIIDSMPQPITLVSGPISTGGAGSLEKNLARFADEIRNLEKQGLSVFDQLPFEYKITEFSKDYKGYYMPILEDFFLPLFKSGKIAKIWFMPGWESSTGAKWEYDQAGHLGIERVILA